MAGNSNSGRKPSTDAAKRARHSLAQMSLASLSTIKKAIHDGDAATARWQQEMILGKPHQRHEHAGDEGQPITLRVIYETRQKPDPTA